MIINNEPLSMSEVLEYVENDKEKSEIVSFIKKFNKIKASETKKMKKKLEELDLMKMRIDHMVKIIDLMPETTDELNKIFVGVSLDEDETKKILETIKEFA